jgi:Xaa-Pro aminopeptidase
MKPGYKMKKNLMFNFLLILLFSSGIFAQDLNFTAQDFRERRDRLCALIPDGIAILDGEAEAGSYFTGIDAGEVKMILIPPGVAEKTPNPAAWKTTLYLPPKTPQSGVWDDPRTSFGDDTLRLVGIENNAPLSSFFSDVAKLENITDTIYIPYREAPISGTDLPRDLQFVDMIRKILPSVRIKNLGPMIDKLRWQKSPREIEVMRKACEITDEAFRQAARKTKPDLFEYEVEALITSVFRTNGGRPAFLILGSGPNSCVLHHMTNDRRMLKDELVVIDIGILYKSMSTDLTRTIPTSGRFSPEQRKIYEIVLEAQKKAISIVKPGVTLADVHKAALEVIEKAGYGRYFIHGTSHPLNGGNSANPLTNGLFMPQKLDNRYFAQDNPLAAGSMFTIEPGIYIPEKNLGVRIEDSVLVTENGYEVLTKSAPKETGEIEELMKKK